MESVKNCTGIREGQCFNLGFLAYHGSVRCGDTQKCGMDNRLQVVCDTLHIFPEPAFTSALTLKDNSKYKYVLWHQSSEGIQRGVCVVPLNEM